MFEIEGINIPEPTGPCPECLSGLKTNQEVFWIECRHNAAIAVMEISEETGKPTGVWEIHSPVDPVGDWIRNRKIAEGVRKYT